MGRYLDIIRQVEEAHKLTDDALPIKPASRPDEQASMPSAVRLPEVFRGDAITWQGVDGKQRGPALVDFLHVDPDGTVWAFCTSPTGWCAVNMRYAVTQQDARHE